MHVLYSFPHRIGSSGIGTTAWHQVHGLLQRGHEVTLAAASVGRPFDQRCEIIETGRLLGLRVPQRLVGVDRMKSQHDRAVARWLYSTLPDVVHTWPGAALRTLEVAAELGIPGVLERPSAHTRDVYELSAAVCAALGTSLPDDHYAAFNSDRLRREELEFEAAGALLCPSEFVRSSHLHAGSPDDVLLRHRYGFDPGAFHPAPGGGVRSGSPFTVVYVGDCYPLKGLHVALEAWFLSGLHRIGRFLICGRFDTSYRALLAHRLNDPSIEELGFTTDVGSIMQRADVLVHPSFAEGSALVTYEARGAGLVVAASTAAGAVLTHDVDGLVHPPGDVEVLTSQLRALARDPGRLSRLRDASVRGSAHLTWDAAAEELERCYRDIRALTAGASELGIPLEAG